MRVDDDGRTADEMHERFVFDKEWIEHDHFVAGVDQRLDRQSESAASAASNE